VLKIVTVFKTEINEVVNAIDVVKQIQQTAVQQIVKQNVQNINKNVLNE